STEQEDP
nr:RecName: Full=Unknown protein 1 [Elaeis guineensis]